MWIRLPVGLSQAKRRRFGVRGPGRWPGRGRRDRLRAASEAATAGQVAMRIKPLETSRRGAIALVRRGADVRSGMICRCRPGRRTRLRRGDEAVPGTARAGGRPALADRARGGDLRPRRAVGRRQDDRAEARQPPDPAQQRRHPHRRHLDPRPRRHRAAALDRLRDPAGRALPAHDRGGQHRHRATALRALAHVDPRALGRAARARRPRPLLREALPGTALRRRAPARRARPRARGEPAADADGRAVRRNRPDRAHPVPGRVPPPAARAAQDRRLRHARHRRGDQGRRPDRDPAARRAPRAVRHPRSGSSASRPTTSSPSSSGPTGRSRRSRCGPSPTCRCTRAPATGCPRSPRERRFATRSRCSSRSGPGICSSPAREVGSSGSRAARTCWRDAAARRRAGDPELRLGQLLRAVERLVLHRLARRSLGRHAPAGSRPAHRALVDRGRRRLRHRLAARDRRLPWRLAPGRADGRRSPTSSTRSRASRSSSCSSRSPA